MRHDVQDGRDAAARARSGTTSRPKPIRYDQDTWLVMRGDPVLPAAIIQRLRNPNGGEFFIAISWDLETEKRRLIGRFPSLPEADAAVLFLHVDPIVGDPREDQQARQKRQEAQAIELARAAADRAKLYGP